MKSLIEELLNKARLWEIKNNEDLEAFRSEFLSKKGHLNTLFEQFKTLDKDQKKEIGQILNILKKKFRKEFEHYKNIITVVSNKKRKCNRFNLSA